MLYKKEIRSPIGSLTLVSDGKVLIGLWMENQKYYAFGMPEELPLAPELPFFQTVETWLDRYFAGEKPGLNEEILAPAGTPFQKSVWNELLKIPYGQTTTYGEIAKRIASGSARAIGGAVGHNPISILIPCHRVIGSAGQLTGYAGGPERKIWLLRHEGVDIESLK